MADTPDALVTQEGGDPKAQLFEYARQQNLPLRFHWDLTWRCDHKCVHCYLTERRHQELTYDECVALLDDLATNGVMFLLISGGDLFLRPDAVDILRAARERRFDVKIITHGNHITEAVADALAEMAISTVALSLYSTEGKEHEAVTRIRESHRKTVAAARMLRARGVEVELKTPVMVHNRVGWADVGELADEIGASWVVDPHIQPDDQLDFGLCGINLPHSERILTIMRDFERKGYPIVPLDALHQLPSEAFTCGAGRSSGHISPDGTLTPCVNWRRPLGSLREQGLGELWNDNAELEPVREVRRASYLVDCEGCTFHGVCGYCPGFSEAETGDAGRRSAYVCERTHLSMAALEYYNRLKAQGVPVPHPSDPAAIARMFETGSTFAERQWAARQSKMSRQADALTPRMDGPLVQIGEPSDRAAEL
jgi:radical SAM protein with 4Fe4S-binding SPASM domain